MRQVVLNPRIQSQMSTSWWTHRWKYFRCILQLSGQSDAIDAEDGCSGLCVAHGQTVIIRIGESCPLGEVHGVTLSVLDASRIRKACRSDCPRCAGTTVRRAAATHCVESEGRNRSIGHVSVSLFDNDPAVEEFVEPVGSLWNLLSWLDVDSDEQQARHVRGDPSCLFFKTRHEHRDAFRCAGYFFLLLARFSHSLLSSLCPVCSPGR